MAVDINALKGWLYEKAGSHLAPEEKQVLENLFAKEPVAQVFHEGFAGRSEINRRLDEIRNKEAELESNFQTQVANVKQYYQNWSGDQQSRVNREVEEIRTQYARDVAALRTQLEAEGLQPSVAQPVKPNGAATPTNGNGEYLTRQEAAAILKEELTKAAMFQGMTLNLAERHRKLFGAPLDVKEVIDIAVRTNKPIEAVWYEKHKVADREAELHNAEIQKKIEDGVAERLAKLQADGAMNAQNFTGRQSDPSPIRQMIAAQRQADANSPLAIPQPVMQQSEGVRAAVEALNSGRFEVKRPGQ